MSVIMIMLIISSTLMTLFNLIITLKKSYKPINNTSMPFECGFSTKKIQMPFSLQFFLITVIFMIFDIELSFLMASIPNMKNPPNKSSLILMFFMIMMWMGLMVELWKNSTKWSK